MDLRWVDDDEVTLYTAPISPKFLAFLEQKHQLKIIKKLGQGMMNAGLRVLRVP